jgi:hypothetical protein
MKKTLAIYIAFIMVGAMIFGACSNDPMSKERLGKDDVFEVEYLFEKDGVKVYRFEDGGRYHYFTTKGETISTQQNSSGKTTTYHEENIKDY